MHQVGSDCMINDNEGLPNNQFPLKWNSHGETTKTKLSKWLTSKVGWRENCSQIIKWNKGAGVKQLFWSPACVLVPVFLGTNFVFTFQGPPLSFPPLSFFLLLKHKIFSLFSAHLPQLPKWKKRKKTLETTMIGNWGKECSIPLHYIFKHGFV